MESFLASVPALLRGLTSAEFANHKDSLITAKLEVPKTLRQETGVYWGEIAQGTYDFRREATDAAVLRTLTVEDVLAYWLRTFDATGPHRRKLSTQFFASQYALPPKASTGVHGRRMVYIDGLEAVLEYKRTLMAFPAPPRCDRSPAASGPPAK